MTRISRMALVAALGLSSSSALAGSSESAGAAPFQIAKRGEPLDPRNLFSEGLFRLDTTFFFDISGGGERGRIFLSPDFWYRLHEKLAVGLVHSSYASTGFYGLPSGICVMNCEDFDDPIDTYNNIGGRALLRLTEAEKNLTLAADAGLILGPFNPTEAELRAGVAGSYRHRDWIFEFNPAVHIALKDRNQYDDFLLVPVTVRYLLIPELSLDVQSGVWGALADFGDAWTVPLSFGGMYRVEWFGVGLRFTFPAAAMAEGDAFEHLTVDLVTSFWF